MAVDARALGNLRNPMYNDDERKIHDYCPPGAENIKYGG